MRCNECLILTCRKGVNRIKWNIFVKIPLQDLLTFAFQSEILWNDHANFSFVSFIYWLIELMHFWKEEKRFRESPFCFSFSPASGMWLCREWLIAIFPFMCEIIQADIPDGCSYCLITHFYTNFNSSVIRAQLGQEFEVVAVILFSDWLSFQNSRTGTN